MQGLLKIPYPGAGAPALITQEKAHQVTGKSRRQIQRWIRRGRVLDPAALRLLQIHCHGLVPGDAWRGWFTQGDGLVSPEGDYFNLRDLRAARINTQLVSALKRQAREMDARARRSPGRRLVDSLRGIRQA